MKTPDKDPYVYNTKRVQKMAKLRIMEYIKHCEHAGKGELVMSGKVQLKKLERKMQDGK